MDKYNLQLRALRSKKDLTLTELAEKSAQITKLSDAGNEEQPRLL